MKTTPHLILIGSLAAALAVGQEPNPPPAPQRTPPPAPPGEGPGRPKPPIDRPAPPAEHHDGFRPEGERRLGDGDRRRPDLERPQRREGDRERGPGDRPRREGDRPHPPGGESGEHRAGRPHARLPEKLQPYIGIITRPAGPELTAQVRLPEGFGLIVEDVLPDSPAQGAGLQRNDLLIRFDDQWLANPPQLEALVRRAGKDKEASLTVLRGGQEQRLTVRIGEKMLPERRGWPGGGFPEMPFGAHGGGFGEQRPQPRPGHVEEQRERRTNYATDRARVVRKDEQGEYELNKADGKRTFVVRKLDGEVVWQGEVGTDEQRQRVPAEWRGKLELMEKTPGLDRLKQEERRSER